MIKKPRFLMRGDNIATVAQRVVPGGERECPKDFRSQPCGGSMPASVRFYRDLLGMELIYGDENGYFSSLRTKDGKDPILNLARTPQPATQWGG